MKAIIKSIVTDCCRAVVPSINKKASAAATPTWSDTMLASYLSINSHVTYSAAQQALILARLQEDYIITTFGPSGQNKSVCDFFLFFQNTNTSTALTSRGWSKTGATLRWNFGGGNVYSQNNLPGQVNNGVVTVTSTDGWSGVTSVSIISDTFSGYLPSFAAFTNMTSFFCSNNSFEGVLPSFNACTKITYFDCQSNSFSGAFPSVSALTSIATFIIHHNSFTGVCPSLAGSSVVNVQMNNNQFTSCGTIGYAKNMNTFNLASNSFDTANVDSTLAAMDSFFAGANAMTANCAVNLSGSTMGIPTNGNSNTNITSLLSKATTAGVTWTITVRTS